MTELNLFSQSDPYNFTGKLWENEIAYCIGGSRNDVFLGTDKGRLLRLKLVENQYKLIESRQFPTKKAVTSIELASALNCLFVICGFEFNTIALDDFKIIPSLSEVTRLAVNANPIVDDPFIVQTAFALGRKGIVVVEITERATKKKFQHDTAMPVRSLAFSRNTICYALENHYLAFNTATKQVIRLFQHDCPTPTIAPDEFLVRSSSGLSIFVNGDGTSSKPPCVISTFKGPFFFREPYIISCERSKVAIQDCFTQHTEEFPFERIDAANYIEGQVLIVANGSQLYCIGETPPETTISSLIERKQYSEAVDILQKSLGGKNDEELLEKLTQCSEKSAIEEIKKGCFDTAISHLICGNMSVSEILNKLRSKQEEIGKQCIPFIKHFLINIRNDANFATQKQIIDVELLNICYQLKCPEELDDLQDLTPEPVAAAEIYTRNNEIRLAAELLFDAQKYSDALPLFVRVGVIYGSSHLRPLLFKIRRLRENAALIPFLSLLAPFFPSEIMQILVNSSYSLYDAQFILRGLPSWEDYLDKQTMYDNIVIELLVVLIADIESGDKGKRGKLRQLILNMESSLADVARIFLDSENLKVERLLCDASKNPITVLNELLTVYKDFDTAEILSAKLAKSHPEIALRLLKAYLDDKIFSTSSNRIGRLLAHVGSNINSEDMLKKLPDSMTVQELSTFLKSSVINKTEANYASQLSLAAAQKGIQSPYQKNKCNPWVELTDHSQCPVCKHPLSYGEQLIILPTRFIVHSKCYKHPHLCPVTNAIF